MVRLKGPGLATKAAGTVGQVMTFATWKGRPYLKKSGTPANPQTGNQRSIRAITAFCAENFATLSASDRQTWQDFAQARNLPIYNAWLSECLRRWYLKKCPSKTYPAAETGSGGTIKDKSDWQQGRHGVLKWRANNLAQNYGYYLLWSTAGPPTFQWNECIQFIHGETTAYIQIRTMQLPLGWNYFRLNSFSVTGARSGIGSLFQINMV
jgi:hypothetical protein